MVSMDQKKSDVHHIHAFSTVQVVVQIIVGDLYRNLVSR